MNIIMGKENAEPLQDKYTVLELDTFNLQPGDVVVTAYAVVDTIPLQELHQVDAMREMHNALIAAYRARNWDYCLSALGLLAGFWGGDIDSFYADLSRRVAECQRQELPPSWNGIISKHCEVK